MRALLVWLVVTWCAAEATLSLPSEAVPGVTLRGVITVVNASSWTSAVLLPEIPGLELRDGGTAGRNTIIVNGVKREEEQRAVQVRVLAEGEYTIPPLTLRLADGTEVQTAAVTLRVTGGDPTLVGEAVASVTFEPAQAVVGQRVTLTYRMAFAEETLRIQEPGIAPPPQATVISEEPLREEPTYAADGKAWRVITKQWVLTVDQPTTLDVSGQQTYYPCRQQRDFFDTRWVATGPARRVAVRPARLTVIDVPLAGRPADWNGLIGDATLRAELDRDRISTGEGARLTVTLVGDQVDRARPLTLPDIPGLRAYPREAPDEAAPTRERHFIWDLVPNRAGRLLIPPLSMSTFDPESESFRSITSPPLGLEVVPGRARELAIVGNVPRAATEGSDATVTTVLPPPLHRQGLTPGPAMVALVFLSALALTGLSLGLRRFTRSGPRPAHRGRRFAKALQQGDLDTAAAYVQDLRTQASGEDRAAAERIVAALDAARFGGGRPDIADADRRRVESLP